jgi:hypothetical protein
VREIHKGLIINIDYMPVACIGNADISGLNQYAEA